MVMRRLHRLYERLLNLKLGTKLLVSFSCIIGLAFTVAVLIFFQLQSLNDNFEQLNNSYQRTEVSEEIHFTIMNEVASTLDHLWSGRGNKSNLSSLTLLQQNFAKLRRLETDPALVAILESLEQQSEELLNFLGQTIELEARNQILEARASWVKGSILFQELNGQFREFERGQYRAVQLKRDQVMLNRNFSIWGILFGCGVIVLAIVGLYIFITRSILRKIKAVSRAMQEVADGRIQSNTRLPVTNRDELGIMATAFNQMTHKVYSAMQGLHSTTYTVSSSSVYFTHLVQHQLSATEQEARALTSIVNATSQLNHAAHQIDTHSESVNRQVEANLTNLKTLTETIAEALEQITRSSETSRSITTGISQMAQETEQISEDVQELLHQLSFIRQIAHNLRKIAEETHLLSLNAAIECAGAGVYGDRFRVVTASIKELSDRSQKLLGEVEFFVGGVEDKAQKVTTRLSQTDAKLSKSQELIGFIEKVGFENTVLATKMLGRVDTINTLLRDSTGHVERIVNDTHEQRLATEEISRTIVQLQDLVNENLQHSHETKSAVEQLKVEIERLQYLGTVLQPPSPSPTPPPLRQQVLVAAE
jgi:methyl-accepting chemotaxis protein